TSAARDDMAATIRYWTPSRMRSAKPLGTSTEPGSAHRANDLALAQGQANLQANLATASYATVPDATAPPYPVIGRLFVKQGPLNGYCSGTAINSVTRQLVLTAGHCVNSGPLDRRRRSHWSQRLLFVPEYTNGLAPLGVFVARHAAVFAPKPWVRRGNPNFDLGAFLTLPNANGQNVADAVGGGASIVLNQNRRQQFQTFGYPGSSRQLQECDSSYTGDDSITYRLPGPPTMAIDCRWRPGASGGGWLIDGGAAIDGLTTYSVRGDTTHTFGPYFASGNVGRLVAGL
ncbi:MAG: trypsin-like serine peptidase, partial [Trebonia sp.]